ncbi:methyl-accepting chemotaxis protein [Virgibacillus litoralis]|uniref:Methyl-accepting chemotaxis protein n=1 Tax=Virgibacillus litoralis TaxID=578221 RepID=A0ABS4HHV6_9BACI|nr:HAMP domain-containing methyl-accepting chemotaxis protein [Virgibacillus litoralis]MBP1950505.1 methyl-accepting chemotaxis protein [Virgibacillus litoralis]
MFKNKFKFNFKKFNFKNVSIGKKYGLILILIFTLFGASTGAATMLISNIGDNVDALERRGDRSINLTEMGSLTRSKGIRIVEYLNSQDQEIADEYAASSDQFDVLETQLSDKMDTKEQQKLFDEIVENDQLIDKLFEQRIVDAIENGDERTAEHYVTQANKLRSETVDLLESLRSIVNEEREAAITQTKESQNLTLIIQVASVVTAIIIGGILAYIVSRKVSHNLNRVVEVSNKIADGDLTVQTIEYNGKDEIGKLATAVNTMSTNLRSVIQQVANVSETVNSQSEELTQSANEVKSGSEQIATTMQELSSGSETQANSASELSTVMGSFSTKVMEANDNGERIQQASSDVLGMTDKGSQLMESSTEQMIKIDQIVKDAVEKVEGLDSKSKEISKLVSVIKDIAEQTNLLALNAAIEAARAGEHGKGFAVVADEVRKLAEQVSVSVTDITEIVASIQNESTTVSESLQGGYREVEQGTGQIKTTSETFNGINTAVKEMVDSINTVSENLSEISAGSQEMNGSIEEIASISEESAAGVEQTSASAQQTSSSMEEVAASSEDLAKLAEELNGLVRQFKL